MVLGNPREGGWRFWEIPPEGGWDPPAGGRWEGGGEAPAGDLP